MKEETNFKEFASAMKSGAKGLRSQMLGVGIEESEARRWILRNSFPFLSGIIWIIDADVTVALTEWDTAKKSAAPDVEKILQSANTSGPIQNIHVVFNDSLTPSLTAPVTEIIVVNTKPGQDLITFGEIINVALRSTAQQPGCVGASWGYTEENKGAAVIIVGWATVEV